MEAHSYYSAAATLPGSLQTCACVPSLYVRTHYIFHVNDHSGFDRYVPLCAYMCAYSLGNREEQPSG